MVPAPVSVSCPLALDRPEGAEDATSVEPPGFTCPQIDKAQRIMRRLAWRIKHRPEAPEDEVARLLEEGLVYLELVRAENKQMRAAYHDMRKKAGENQ